LPNETPEDMASRLRIDMDDQVNKFEGFSYKTMDDPIMVGAAQYKK
jgi:hypothetical protein